MQNPGRWLMGVHFAALALGATASAQCEEKVVAEDGAALSYFGTQLDADESTLVAVSPKQTADGDPGEGYVYRRVGDDWVLEQKLQVSGVDNGWGVGSVSIHGDRLVVGDAIADGARGAAYLFEREGSVWTETQKLTASDPHSGDYFGGAVALSGDRLVVGAHGFGSSSQLGAAYVFRRDATGWYQEQKITASDPGPGDEFGTTVAIEGETVLVCAIDADLGGTHWVGAVYVFERVGELWAETQRLDPSVPSFATHFGASMAIRGDVMVIGAPRPVLGGGPGGSAYVFRRTGETWSEERRLIPSQTETLDFFGQAADWDGRTIAVGALTAGGGGKTYLFEHDGVDWVERQYLVASDASFDDSFGGMVALAPQFLAVGARQDDDVGFNSGSVYTYDLGCLLAFETYCRCDEGAPCGNEAAWTGCVNSTGAGALLAAGPTSTNRVSTDDLQFSVSNLPVNQFGIVYMGPHQECVPFGDGLRAVQPGPPGPGYFRFRIHSTGAGGSFTEGPGIVAYSEAHFGGAGGAIAPGSTWNFQGFYRDPAGPCGSGFNLSNALRVVFHP